MVAEISIFHKLRRAPPGFSAFLGWVKDSPTTNLTSWSLTGSFYWKQRYYPAVSPWRLQTFRGFLRFKLWRSEDPNPPVLPHIWPSQYPGLGPSGWNPQVSLPTQHVIGSSSHLCDLHWWHYMVNQPFWVAVYLTCLNVQNVFTLWSIRGQALWGSV